MGLDDGLLSTTDGSSAETPLLETKDPETQDCAPKKLEKPPASPVRHLFVPQQASRKRARPRPKNPVKLAAKDEQRSAVRIEEEEPAKDEQRSVVRIEEESLRHHHHHHQVAQQDRYDPLVPNDLLQYRAFRRAHEQEIALRQERDRRIAEQEQLRKAAEAEEQKLKDSGDYATLVDRKYGGGRRGVSNVPAWLLEKQRQEKNG